jgi:hypothetical protein
MPTTPNSIITPQTPNAGVLGVILSTAMTNTKAWDGTEAAGTAMALVYTVGASGGRVEKVVVRPSGTAGATPSAASTATRLAVWVNNGSANTTAANNALIADLTVATFTPSAVASVPGYEIPIGLTLPAGYKIFVGIATAIGGTNDALAVSCFGADL